MENAIAPRQAFKQFFQHLCTGIMFGIYSGKCQRQKEYSRCHYIDVYGVYLKYIAHQEISDMEGYPFGQ